MSSALAGWLALGALIAFVGTLCERGTKKFLIMAGVVVVAWGFAPMLSTVHIGSTAPSAVAAPEPAPEITVPPVTEAPAPERSGVGFWEGLSSPAKFFLVFLGIFALGCFIGFASQSSDTAGQIIGGIIGFIVGAVGVVGMLVIGCIRLFSRG